MMNRLVMGAITFTLAIFLITGCDLLKKRTVEVNGISMNPTIQVEPPTTKVTSVQSLKNKKNFIH
jgi:hypothetical protein